MKKVSVKAAKKEGRIAAEGLTRVAAKGNTGILFEVNSETDFVAKNEQFLAFIRCNPECYCWKLSLLTVDAAYNMLAPEGTIG